MADFVVGYCVYKITLYFTKYESYCNINKILSMSPYQPAGPWSTLHYHSMVTIEMLKRI